MSRCHEGVRSIADTAGVRAVNPRDPALVPLRDPMTRPASVIRPGRVAPEMCPLHSTMPPPGRARPPRRRVRRAGLRVATGPRRPCPGRCRAVLHAPPSRRPRRNPRPESLAARPLAATRSGWERFEPVAQVRQQRLPTCGHTHRTLLTRDPLVQHFDSTAAYRPAQPINRVRRAPVRYGGSASPPAAERMAGCVAPARRQAMTRSPAQRYCQ
jgi:hypothetical protein